MNLSNKTSINLKLLKYKAKSILNIDKKKSENAVRIYRIVKLFSGKNGIEIGGPSSIFNHIKKIPVYMLMENCDGVNFSQDTVWTGNIDLEEGYIIDNKIRGKQFIADATDLSAFPAENYDFVLSSNNIEHIANPLKAFEEWLRILKRGGLLLVIAPRKELNFDHKRSVVKFEHLLDDYNNGITEEDLTHLDEILELHDLQKDKAAGTLEQFKERSLKNFENRCLHHHVFDSAVLRSIYSYFGLDVIDTIQLDSDYIIVGRKN